ncbi:oocyte zinc finger protein XlCOF8.4-like [Hyla sarda]|uniref:oocyte zinc finger protein XlCOF8.4-like n=1 Tax=Hyla sarda TaxID=327740 RepID=UPI0024C3A945|nr:oocyte zinc finger protein XlCOF8.4-like [Hyla sarda]
MPRCFVERCHNYGGKRLNIILHSFPNNLDKIKIWLRYIEQSGHVIRDMEELAQRIFEGKTNNRFRVCSEHFTEQSYQPSGLRKTLRKDAVPTIFRDVPPQKCPWQKVKPALKNMDTSVPGAPNRGTTTSQQPHRHSVSDLFLINPSVLNHQRCGRTNLERTIKATKHLQHNIKETKEGYGMSTKRTDVTHVILKLTLEIICLLTGEDYIVVKKSSSHGGGWGRTLSSIMEPPSLIHVKNNEKRILHLTSKIMELLTREKCEYVEDRQKGVRIKGHGALASLDDMVNGLSDPGSTRTVKETSCEEKEDVPMGAGHRRQFQFNNIKVEAVSNDGRNVPDPNTVVYADDTQHYPSTHVKEELVLCGEGNLTAPEIPAASAHTQHTSHIKEEPALREGGNLIDPNRYTPTDPTQQYPSLIKEEPVKCEGGNAADPDIYTPTDHVDHYSLASMEEPFLCDGGNPMDPHPSNCVMEEPLLCREGKAVNSDTYTESPPSSAHPEHETETAQDNDSLFDKGNLDTDIYALIKHAQAKYTFSRIEDGSSSEEDENPKDADSLTPADQAQHRPPPHGMEGEAAVPQTFKCRDCSECFTRKSGLINHRRNHRQEKLTCSKCGKVFSKRSSLQNHLTLHTGEKPFACPVCGKCFARKSNLISHETIHSGKASYICAECGRYFVCKVHLTKHQIIHEK